MPPQVHVAVRARLAVLDELAKRMELRLADRLPHETVRGRETRSLPRRVEIDWIAADP